MAKKAFLVVSLAMLLIMSSCGQKEENHDEKATQATEEIAAPEYEKMYEAAKKANDYVGMNKALELSGQAYDPTHGGILHGYAYSAKTLKGEVKEGFMYILSLDKSYTNEKMEQIADAQSIGANDYVVLDYTFISDPCLQVRNSYRADDTNVRSALLDIIIAHEEKMATSWQRSKASMEQEWYVHNLSYAAGYKIERAQHVDLNNNDEVNYK